MFGNGGGSGLISFDPCKIRLKSCPKLSDKTFGLNRKSSVLRTTGVCATAAQSLFAHAPQNSESKKLRLIGGFRLFLSARNFGLNLTVAVKSDRRRHRPLFAVV